MTFPANSAGLQVPNPFFRPAGDTANYSAIAIPAAGVTRRPPTYDSSQVIRHWAYTMIRVLDDEGCRVGPWIPGLGATALQAGLRAMMLTRAYDTRVMRVQRQGKSSFNNKSTGEDAVAVTAAMAAASDCDQKIAIGRAKPMSPPISCDHRLVDGWDAASYAQALKKLIETPVLLFAN